MENINIADILTWYVAFLFSFTAHEAAHAFAAMKGGDLTAYHGGQVSLNPVPHIKRSPFGTVIVPLISYFLAGWMIGWASAPYDPLWAQRHPRRAAWMAAAGPGANFLIALTAFVLIKIGLATGVFSAPPRATFSSVIAAQSELWLGVSKLLSIFLMLNVILLIFNLLPFPPLDGSSIITLFMSDHMALKYRDFIRQPAFAFLGIVLAWKLFGSVFGVIFRMVLALLHPGSSYQ